MRQQCISVGYTLWPTVQFMALLCLWWLWLVSAAQLVSSMTSRLPCKVALIQPARLLLLYMYSCHLSEERPGLEWGEDEGGEKGDKKGSVGE